MSPEERKAQKAYHKMKETAADIKYDYYETMMSFDDDGKLIFKHTDKNHSSVGWGDHDFNTEMKNKNVVHNHPEGSCFSPEDLNVGLYTKSMWAVTTKFIQIFQWNHNIYDSNFVSGGWRQKAYDFMGRLESMHNTGAFYDLAKAQWNKAHDAEMSVAHTWDWEKYKDWSANREREIKELIRQKQREFFKNHQKEYGYTFKVRSW